jgi:hypothetical protein
MAFQITADIVTNAIDQEQLTVYPLSAQTSK